MVNCQLLFQKILNYENAYSYISQSVFVEKKVDHRHFTAHSSQALKSLVRDRDKVEVK